MSVVFLNGTLWTKGINGDFFEAFDNVEQNKYRKHIPGSLPLYCTIELCSSNRDDDSPQIKSIVIDYFLNGIGKITLQQNKQTDVQAEPISVVAYLPDRRAYCNCCFGDTFLQTNHSK